MSAVPLEMKTEYTVDGGSSCDEIKLSLSGSREITLGLKLPGGTKQAEFRVTLTHCSYAWKSPDKLWFEGEGFHNGNSCRAEGNLNLSGKRVRGSVVF